ncbi:MAG: phenylalanine--tRNA ligase subunit beta [Candidatus Methanomethylophilaceae archaeon]|nr:phenylalanine--tRNA ligase subunit beta [Candidatus Methanomethylophilaceae archaeon]
MPVINFNYHDLCHLLGEEVPREVLIERIPMMGADMHDMEGIEDEMSVEFFPDRPDLFCVEGLARSLRAFLGLEPGMHEYESEETDIVMHVEDSVLTVRPYIVCAAVFDVEIDDRFIRSLMEVQEKLHTTIGRKRSKVAIGVHDLDKVRPPFRYLAVEPHVLRFVPLGKEEEWDLEEILDKHEKGRDYAHLLQGKDRYPVILDANDDVLSFPPVINGRLTTVTEETKNIFIDVTGTDARAVEGALQILVTALAERGGSIGDVTLRGAYDAVHPDLEPSYWEVSIPECRRLLSPSLSAEDMVIGLQRMGHDAQAEGDLLKVLAPSTRLDILHPVDLMEDVAIGHGFERFGCAHTTYQTVGGLLPSTRVSERLRDVMIGLGYTEVNTLMLSSERDEFHLCGLEEEDVVSIKNPITEDHTCLRRNLMPSLLRILRRNKHRDLPQRIFEAGDVLVGHQRRRSLAGMSIHSKASFTEIKSTVESLLREMDISFSIVGSDRGCYVSGRGADIIHDNQCVGSFGELSPQTIVNFGLGYPVAAFELDTVLLLSGKGDAIF